MRWLLGVVGLGGALALALVGCGPGSEPASAASGERASAHVEKTCLGCHPSAKLDAMVRARLGEKDGEAALDAFLSRHHVGDPELRAEVLTLLRARVGLERIAP